jgi:putative methyltransferase (TIGR04325 family)
MLNRASGFLRDLRSYPHFSCDHNNSGFCIYCRGKCTTHSVQYRGVYPDFRSASSALPSGKLHGFDSKSLVDNLAEHFSQFNPGDYPILLRLAQILRPGDTVFDLGGGSGQSYYAYREFIEFPPDLRWLVCDVEAFTEMGKKVAHERGATPLAFTNNWQDADGVPVYLTNGALQYIEPGLAEILHDLSKRPKYVLINRIPTYDGPSYYTIQRGLRSYSPYKIINTGEFVRGMEQLGYKRMDQWSLPRGLRVPFHPECVVPAYQGFYFVLR